MSDRASEEMRTAFNVIDSVADIRGVTGAMLVDNRGGLIAEDFASAHEQQACIEIGTDLVPALAEQATAMEKGDLNAVIIQTTSKTLSFSRRQRIWLEVFADKDLNLGMLNVEMRSLEPELISLGGGAVVDERASEMEHIRDVLDASGDLESMIAERTDDLGALRALQGLLFQMTNDAGVSKATISQRIQDINYRIYRDSLLDIGFDFFNRKSLDNYDPALARQVMREQIRGFVTMLKEAELGLIR